MGAVPSRRSSAASRKAAAPLLKRAAPLTTVTDIHKPGADTHSKASDIHDLGDQAKVKMATARATRRETLNGESSDQIDRTEVDALSNGLVQVVERFKGEPTFAHLTMQEVVRSRVAELAAKLL